MKLKDRFILAIEGFKGNTMIPSNQFKAREIEREHICCHEIVPVVLGAKCKVNKTLPASISQTEYARSKLYYELSLHLHEIVSIGHDEEDNSFFAKIGIIDYLS